MALIVKDRVRETSTNTGTGAFTLAGAVSGFQPFSVLGDGNTTYYTIVDAATGTWEVGIGTYTLSSTTLSRDTILASSNSGSAVSFGAGTKIVFCTYPADKSMFLDAADDFSMAGTITTGGASLDGAVVINESGADVDFRVESDTDANAFVLDGASGNIGIGTIANPAARVLLSGAITGDPFSRGLYVTAQIKSDATSIARYFATYATTEAAAFTCSNLRHYDTYQSSFGAGSTVTNQSGFYVDSSLTGATNNYGFYSNIPSGTGRYNFYSSGAESYFDSNVEISAVLRVREAIDLADNDILRFGTGDDWEMFHNGTNNYMDLNVGNLYIRDTTTTRFTFERTTGNFTATGNVTAYSDERLKKDWATLPENFVERLSKVKAGTYTRTDTGERQAGASAQDWKELLPEVVTTAMDEAEMLSLAYGNAALVSAVELAKTVVAIKAELESLKIEVAALKGK